MTGLGSSCRLEFSIDLVQNNNTPVEDIEVIPSINSTQDLLLFSRTMICCNKCMYRFGVKEELAINHNPRIQEFNIQLRGSKSRRMHDGVLDMPLFPASNVTKPLTLSRLLNFLLSFFSHSTQTTIKIITMAAIQRALDAGAVPSHISNVCPEGTKAYLLEVGWLECDEGFVVRGGNTSLKSTEGTYSIVPSPR